LANRVAEADLPGDPNICIGLHEERQDLIDAFVEDARSLVEVWARIRGTPDLDSFNGNALCDRLTQFELDWVLLPSNTGGGPDRRQPISIWNHDPGLREIRRQLRSGRFRRYIQEIELFNPFETCDFVNLVEVDPTNVQHRYSLQVNVGLQAGAGKLVLLKQLLAPIAFPMKTTSECRGASISWHIRRGGGAGASVSPISVNVDTSLGTDVVNAGSASTWSYKGPFFFNGSLVGYTTGGASLGGGLEVSSINFQGMTRSLSFHTSGLTMRFGTDVVGSASATGGLGVAHRIGPVRPLIVANLYFITGDATLDASDLETIDEVIASILRRDQEHPGFRFSVNVVGFASRRYDFPPRGMTPREANEALAAERARVVAEELTQRLDLIAPLLTPHLFGPLGRGFGGRVEYFKHSIRIELNDDNPQEDRAVMIGVHYQPCHPEGHIYGWTRRTI
jgi:hypothetical protein